jgi:hypothetical protein
MKHSGFVFTAIGALTLMLAAAPASAQTQSAAGDMGSNSGGLGTLTGIPTAREGADEATVQKRREIEEAYKKVTKSQPSAQQAVNDPWANMRGDEPKPAAKTVAKTAKTAHKKKPAQ